MSEKSTTVFVTGATGFLGQRLVEALAIEGHQVLALCRRGSRRGGEAWLKHWSRTHNEAGAQVTFLSGDLCHPGIFDDEVGRDRMLSETEIVIHCGAATHLAVDSKLAHRSNVEGTQELLRTLDGATALRRIVHCSAASVAGDFEGRFTEAMLDVGQSHYNHCSRTKMLGEQAVVQAMDRLPITVVRPSHLVGDAQTGRVEKVDGVYHLFLLLLRMASLPVPLRILPWVPGGDWAWVDLVPVDYAATAIRRLAWHEEAEGKTFHLCDPDARTVESLVRLVASELGIRGPFISSRGRPLAMFLRGRRFGPVRMALDQLLNLPPELADGLAHRAIYDTERTEAVLGPLGVSVPPLESYIGTLLSYARDRVI